MANRYCCILAVSVLAAGTATAAVPDWRAAGDALGRGVHAYISGNSAAAKPLLVEAMSLDPRDPRPRYFHGLCLLRQGRNDEARADFKIAATLEARSRGSYPVGKSLERVQGGDRWVLEQYRWPATHQEAASKVALGQFDSSRRATIAMHTDADVLRHEVSVPLDRLVQPVSLAELADLSVDVARTSSSSADPFADDRRVAPEGKIPSGKLLGILRHAIERSTPVPSLDAIRQQVLKLPLPGVNHQSPVDNTPSGADPEFAPAADNPFGSPFSEPAPGDTEAKTNDQPTNATEDEDPFGGF